MTFDAAHAGPDSLAPRYDDEDDHDQGGTALRAPVVDAAKDRLNPEMEYEVLSLTGDDAALKTKLNDLGKDGWVLVSTAPSFIFRRIKKTEDEKKKSRVGFSL